MYSAIDAFQAFGLTDQTTPHCRESRCVLAYCWRHKRDMFMFNVLLLKRYLWLRNHPIMLVCLLFYNVCPPAWNIKKKKRYKNDSILFMRYIRATWAGNFCCQAAVGFLFRWEGAWIFECIIKLRLLKTHHAAVASARSASSTFVFPLIRFSRHCPRSSVVERATTLRPLRPSALRFFCSTNILSNVFLL